MNGSDARELPHEDPGWPRGLAALVVVVPGGLRWYLGHHGGDGLVMLRSVTLAFRTRFFLRLALAEAVALFAFAFAFSGAAAWTYHLGAAFTLARLWFGIVPTRARLAREQELLHLRGCARSLIAALRSAPVR